MKKAEDKTEKGWLSDRWNRLFIWVAALLPLVIAGIYLLIVHWVLFSGAYSTIDTADGLSALEKRGVFGDSAGLLNALFAGWAFGFVLVAIRLQRKEIKLQQISAREYKKEVEARNSQAELERFETKFFKLLDDLRNLKMPCDKLVASVKSGEKTDPGDIIKNAFQEFRHPHATVGVCLHQNQMHAVLPRHKDWTDKIRAIGEFESYFSWLLLTYQYIAASSKEALFKANPKKLSFYLGLLSASLPRSVQYWLAIELGNDENASTRLGLNDLEQVVFTKIRADSATCLESLYTSKLFRVPAPVKEQS